MTMNPIDSFPEALPLREALPRMRPETEAALIAWACAQPGSLSWLLCRAAQYWDGGVSTDAPTEDAQHLRIEATCALELLRHRTGYPTDRETVEHLLAPLSAPPNAPGERPPTDGVRTRPEA